MDDMKQMNDPDRLGADRKPRVAIIGGGMAGLIAALYAAREGAAVTVLEGARQFGSRAQTALEKGFAVNMGPHALYNHGAAKQALDDLGITVTGGMPRGADYRAFVGAKAHHLPMDLMSIWRTSLFSLRDRWAFTRFFAQLPKLKAAEYVGMTVNEMLNRLIPAKGARAAMHALVRLTTYSDAPTLMCAGAVVDQLQMGMGGVTYLDGGWQQMVDALVAASESRGVALLTGQKATAVARKDSGFEINCAKGGKLVADAVILALGPKQAAALASDLVPALAGYAEDAMPVRAACLDVGVTNVPDMAATFGLGVDAPMYYSNHAAVAAQAPAGGGMFHAAKYLDPESREQAGELELQLAQFLSLSQPGWEKHAVVQHFRPNMLVSNWLPLAANGGVAGRPAVETSWPGLYLAGDWVGPDGLLSDAAAASARNAGTYAAHAADQCVLAPDAA